MGVSYEMQCHKCGIIFTHDEGYSLMQQCPTCGGYQQQGTTIICPNCHTHTEQDTEAFHSQLRASFMWE